MTTPEREDRLRFIMRYVSVNPFCTVFDIHEAAGSSLQTIRRDIGLLEDNGDILTVRMWWSQFHENRFITADSRIDMDEVYGKQTYRKEHRGDWGIEANPDTLKRYWRLTDDFLLIEEHAHKTKATMQACAPPPMLKKFWRMCDRKACKPARKKVRTTEISAYTLRRYWKMTDDIVLDRPVKRPVPKTASASALRLFWKMCDGEIADVPDTTPTGHRLTQGERAVHNMRKVSCTKRDQIASMTVLTLFFRKVNAESPVRDLPGYKTIYGMRKPYRRTFSPVLPEGMPANGTRLECDVRIIQRDGTFHISLDCEDMPHLGMSGGFSFAVSTVRKLADGRPIHTLSFGEASPVDGTRIFDKRIILTV